MFEDIKCKKITEMKIDHRGMCSKEERVNNIIEILSNEEYLKDNSKKDNCNFVFELENMISYIKYGYVE